MGLFDKLFGRAPKVVSNQYFDTLTAYTPSFTSWSGSLYESELVRAAIDAKARHISKLKIEFRGAAKPKLRSALSKAPNEFQTWGQFLYRTSTILDMQNTAFIVPVIGEREEITGIFSVLPSQCELVEASGKPYIRYTFSNGKKAAMRLSDVGILTKFQYKSDLFGDGNSALNNTMQLIEMQNQGIEEAVKSSATYRFMAQVSNFSKPEDLEKERKRFTAKNLSAEAEGGGMLLFPNTYTNIQQIKNSPYTVDHEQMKLIKTNVYNYFGVNEDVLQNKAYGDSWSAFFEGAIEPFSIQLSDVLTSMLFTDREVSQGSTIIATANRLQYLSNSDKLNVSAQMADRGIMTINEIREIWNLPPVDGGDIRVVRGEYKNSDDINVIGENDG